MDAVIESVGAFLLAVGLLVITLKVAWHVLMRMAKNGSGITEWPGAEFTYSDEDQLPALTRCDCEHCRYHDAMLSEPVGYTLGMDPELALESAERPWLWDDER